MNHLPVAIVSSATAVLLIASLAGCAPASSGSAVGGTTAPSAAAKAAPVGSSDGACKYLSIADLDSLLDRSYTASVSVPLHDPIEYSYCKFTGPGREFDLLVSTSDPTDVISVEQEAAGNALKPLSGVGDNAFSDNSEVVVQYGQDVIASGDDILPQGAKVATTAQLEAVAAKTHSHM